MTGTQKSIAVLKGGWNAERDVSLRSAQRVVCALNSMKQTFCEIVVTRDIGDLIHQLDAYQPDLVFLNALHGQGFEDGRIQSLMELLGYPYTGSGVIASALAMDKGRARDVMRDAGVRVPKGHVYVQQEFFDAHVSFHRGLTYPFVVKPLSEGSSVGVSYVAGAADLAAVGSSWIYGTHVLVEDFIAGRELSVAMLGEEYLGMLELVTPGTLFDYHAKVTQGAAEHKAVDDLSDVDLAQVQHYCKTAIRAMGVEGISRVDLRYDPNRPEGARVYVLEVNTLPGLTDVSLVPDIITAGGYDFSELIQWIIQNHQVPKEFQACHKKNLDNRAVLKVS